jgi:hypothetical protein
MAWQAVTFDDAAKERIKAAADFERTMRLESLLLLPAQIKPFELMPLTSRNFLHLEYAQNRITTGGAMLDDFVHLLWTVKPPSDNRSEKAFAKFAAKKLTSKHRAEIEAWFHVQFNDMPRSGEGGNVNEFESGIWLCSVIDTLASEYGWNMDMILDTPLSSSFQLFQRIAKRNNSKYSLRNGITQAAKAKEMKGTK